MKQAVTHISQPVPFPKGGRGAAGLVYIVVLFLAGFGCSKSGSNSSGGSGPAVPPPSTDPDRGTGAHSASPSAAGASGGQPVGASGSVTLEAALANGRSLTTGQWLELYGSTTDPERRSQLVAAASTAKSEATSTVLRRGIADPEFVVRREAIIGAQYTYPALGLKDVLLGGLSHEDVNTQAESMDKIKTLPPERRAEIYESVIRGNYSEGIKKESLMAFGNINTKHTCDVLLEVAPSLPPPLQKEAMATFNYLVRQSFSKPGEAAGWWSQNQKDFDDTLGFLR